MLLYVYVLNDNKVLVCSYDGSMMRWNVETGKCLKAIKKDDNIVKDGGDVVNECFALHCTGSWIIKGV